MPRLSLVAPLLALLVVAGCGSRDAKSTDAARPRSLAEFASTCTARATANAAGSCVVPLQMLLSSPDAFRGARITTVGVLVSDSDRLLLYPSCEAVRLRLLTSTITVVVPISSDASAEAARGLAPVRITGTFRPGYWVATPTIDSPALTPGVDEHALTDVSEIRAMLTRAQALRFEANVNEPAHEGVSKQALWNSRQWDLTQPLKPEISATVGSRPGGTCDAPADW